MNDRRRPFKSPVVMKYVLHLCEGTAHEIPVVLGQHIDQWSQEDPKSLPGARVAWAKPLAALGGRWAVPAVLSITLGSTVDF